MRVMTALAAAVMLAAPASAAWQATSAHFVVYADADEAALRQQARELELFDAALRRFHGVPDTPDARQNKVTVFVLPTVDAVQRLLRADGVAGIYMPRVEGSVAFTPARGDGRGITALSQQVVLFHEYAHHFLLGNFPLAFPAWFSEGYAEFAATARIEPDGVTLGYSATHRAHGLTPESRVAAARLFSPSLPGVQTESLYGQGWLLTHYIQFNPARRQQFGRYLELLDKGRASLPAAREAFGDLATLDVETARYLKQPTLPAVKIRASSLGEPNVALRALGPGESALMSLRMQSVRGTDHRTARSLFEKARMAAAPFATDAIVQGWLAEMAFDAGDDAAAEAAADAALRDEPTNSQALLYKGRVLLRRAARAKADAAGWTAARQPILRANRANTDDAAALALFYRSFVDQKATPSPGAIAGLYRAAVLVPQDRAVRFLAARQRLVDGDTAAARALLRPLAFDPHLSTDNQAARLLGILDSGKSGQAALDALDGGGRG